MPERSGLRPSQTAELLARCHFPSPDREVVCGVSGGADSLALLALASFSGLSVTAVHVDHGLRVGSTREADVVADAAGRFGAGFRSERIVVADGSDLEARARQARRAALGPDAMTGHTADDQAETVFINLMRGTGLAGLAAMRPGPRHPLLSLRRFETRQLCTDLGLDPVDDPSNLDPRFVRNRVRAEVLPLLADISDRDPVPLIIRTADRARAAGDELQATADCLDPTDARLLQSVSPEVARLALRKWLRDGGGHPPDAASLDRVMAVVNMDRMACELPGGRRVSRHDGVLRISPIDPGRDR